MRTFDDVSDMISLKSYDVMHTQTKHKITARVLCTFCLIFKHQWIHQRATRGQDLACRPEKLGTEPPPFRLVTDLLYSHPNNTSLE